jgi:hypothetical protein
MAVKTMTKLEMMQLSQSLSDLYTGLETDLIANIAEYLAAGKIDSPTAQWKIQMLAQLGALDKSNIKVITEYAGIAPDMLTEVLETAALSAVEELEPGFQKLARNGIIYGTEVPIEKTMARALTSYQKQAKQSLNMVNTVMRYKAKSAAQKIINDTAELAEKQSFINTLNKATGKVVTGAESRQAAMRQCIKEMSEKGIPAFVDKLGREWSPEAYINMDIRTTANNVAHQAQFDRMEDYGVDLIEVSSHAGARPKCAEDQGKIFNRKNKDGYTIDLHGRKIKYYSWKKSSYGEPDGILGINCGHHIYPFISGISYQKYFPYDEYDNQEQYKKVQGQRELERRVRKSKRECIALESVGDTEGLKKAKETLKTRQQALKQYCTDNDLKYKPDRTAVVNYKKSVAGFTPSDKKKRIAEIKAKSVDKSGGSAAIPKVLKSEFVPAKSIEEAQKYAQKYVKSYFGDKTFKGDANFKGISIDNANEINRALTDIFDNYGFPKISGIKPIDPLSAKGKKIFSSADAVMAYSPVEHGVYINKNVLKNNNTLTDYHKNSSEAWETVMDNIDKLSGPQKELALRYKEAGRTLVGDGSAYDYFVHEIGHHIEWEVFDAKTNNLIGNGMKEYAGKISGYATSSKSEYFAESFSAFVKGEYNKLDPEYIEFIRLYDLSIKNK